ncbi:MAG: hypothetical protein K6E84_08095 [Lachnospiraceae bacterium]|nr:hypothetical protein [Lachnospiraceae bacterium]
MKKSKIFSVISGLLLAVAVAIIPMNVKADWVNVDSDSYGISYSYDSQISPLSSYITSKQTGGGGGNASIYVTSQYPYVSNVKCNNKKFKVKLTQKRFQEYDGTKSVSGYSIGYYAKKKGKAKISFDVLDKDGKKVETKSFTVTAKEYTYPIKYVKYGSQYVTGGPLKENDKGVLVENNMAYTTKKSGKLKIKMNKGYKLDKIEVTTYKKNGMPVTKTIKNNKKISVTSAIKGTQVMKYTSPYGASNNYTESTYHNPMMLSTRLYIYYTNKKTKEKGTDWYYIYFYNKK